MLHWKAPQTDVDGETYDNSWFGVSAVASVVEFVSHSHWRRGTFEWFDALNQTIVPLWDLVKLETLIC